VVFRPAASTSPQAGGPFLQEEPGDNGGASFAAPKMSNTNPQRGTVVVTGVSTGIGRAIAEDLMAAGYTVFGSVRQPGDAQPLADAFGDRFVPLVFDVTDAEALPAAVEVVREHLCGETLTALVNNAGVSVNGPLMYQPMAEIRRTFEVNVFGLLAVSRAFLPLLGAGGEPVARPGRIVNIGSVQGAITVPFMGAYSSSKHAVEAISQALRRELMLFGIEVSTIEPSFIRSALYQKAAVAGQVNAYAGTRYKGLWQQFTTGLVQQEATAKPPQLVTRAVLQAIASARPRPRYPLDPIWTIGRVVSDRIFDKIILRALGMLDSLRAPTRAVP